MTKLQKKIRRVVSLVRRGYSDEEIRAVCGVTNPMLDWYIRQYAGTKKRKEKRCQAQITRHSATLCLLAE